MQFGPIYPKLPGLSTGHSPVKPIKIASDVGKQAILFDSEYSYSLQSKVPEYVTDTVIYETTQTLARARIGQFIELVQNSEWHRSGFYIGWRDDGVTDNEDGWYNPGSTEISEDLIFSGYAEPKIDVYLRQRLRPQIGCYFDSKLQPNDAGAGGVALVAYPGGVDLTSVFPARTYRFSGVNGNIDVVENPGLFLRAPLTTPADTMTKLRCAVFDEVLTPGVSTEVFYKDHRLQNGYYRINNELIRYTLHQGDTASLVEVYSGSAWVSIGSLQYQAYSGAAYTNLPLKEFRFLTISPDEVTWDETRYDAGGIGLLRNICRIRRGSRLLEVQAVSASGQGLTGAQSIGLLTGSSNYGSLTTSTDGTADIVDSANTSFTAGFCDLTAAPNAATLPDATHFYYGGSVPAGTVTRFGVLAGYHDAQYTSLSTLLAYINKWTSYNRQRIKQRLLVG